MIVIGHNNDVDLYRDLLAAGISEYLVAPLDLMSIIAVISRLYRAPGAAKLGRSFAFVGARVALVSSTIAHNTAATIGRLYKSSVILADLDVRFGTAGLDFKLAPGDAVAELLEDPSRVDDMFLERLLIKHDKHLSILTSPASLEKSYDLRDSAFERLLEITQAQRFIRRLGYSSYLDVLGAKNPVVSGRSGDHRYTDWRVLRNVKINRVLKQARRTTALRQNLYSTK